MVVVGGNGLGLLWVGCFCFGEEWVGFVMGLFLFWRRVCWVCYGFGVFVLEKIHVQKEKERKKERGIDGVENNK